MYRWLEKHFQKHRMKRERGEKGFTLIELVVVIAIMGILGGVGTVGYSGYMKSSAKKADMAVVGNIQRAIDVGSYAFNIDSPLQISADGKTVRSVEIPVGFIVIGKNGTAAMESLNKQGNKMDQPCKIEEVTLYVLGEELTVKENMIGCGESASGTKQAVYEVLDDNATFTCCTTHSVIPTKTIMISTGDASYNMNTVTVQAKNFSYLVGGEFDNAINPVHVQDKPLKDAAYMYGQFVENSNGVLSEVLRAAYGNEEIVLQSDEWKITSIPSFYKDGTAIFNKIETFVDTIMEVTGGSSETKIVLNGQERNVLGQNHNSSEDLLLFVARDIVDVEYNTFLDKWKELDQCTDGTINGSDAANWGGFASGNRETYSTVRQAYNSGFASYVKSNTSGTTHNATNCASAIEEFGEPGAFGIHLPKAIHLKQFEEGGDLDCSDCLALYKQYTTDGSSEANAKAVYDTLTTISTNGKEFMGSTGKGLFDWYESYLNEFQQMHAMAQRKSDELGGNCIIITVYSREGKLHYDVAPKEADPRGNN